MSDEAINNIVNRYVRDNLSPKPAQRNYISEKYEELQSFLSQMCFQSGSYPRYTAIDPVHDLDVIYPVTDTAIQDNPSATINSLLAQLQGQYKDSATKVKRIYAQTHSVTIEFGDAPEGTFSIDVVPAIELSDKNEYSPLYLVPEILRLNRHNRQDRYERVSERPIDWIRSDPRGYIRAASDLNESNNNFRHATKLLKGWRHACKMAYGEDFRLKSFHFEQIVYRYFSDNPSCSTVEAIIDCLATLPSCLDEPQFADRADANRFIDEYVSELTQEQRQLILRLQADAFTIARQLPASSSEQDVIQRLAAMTNVRKQAPVTVAPAARAVSPHQPWGY